MKLKRTHLLSRLANAGSFVVLVLLLVSSIWAASLIQQTTSAAKDSTAVSDTYEQILYLLSQQEALRHAYVLTPSPVVRNEHLATATTLMRLLQDRLQDSTPGDNVLDQQILTQEAGYLFYAGQFFAAIDAKDLTRARTIQAKQIDPLFRHIETELSQQASVERAEETHDLVALFQLQQMIALTAPIMFALGLLLLGISTYVQRSYRRKLDTATQAELARLERLALTDPLTSLGNHYAYQEQPLLPARIKLRHMTVYRTPCSSIYARLLYRLSPFCR